MWDAACIRSNQQSATKADVSSSLGPDSVMPPRPSSQAKPLGIRSPEEEATRAVRGTDAGLERFREDRGIRAGNEAEKLPRGKNQRQRQAWQKPSHAQRRGDGKTKHPVGTCRPGYSQKGSGEKRQEIGSLQKWARNCWAAEPAPGSLPLVPYRAPEGHGQAERARRHWPVWAPLRTHHLTFRVQVPSSFHSTKPNKTQQNTAGARQPSDAHPQA